MAVSFRPPRDAIGAELVWWREDGHDHTLVTIAGTMFVLRLGVPSVTLTFALHDVEGRFVASWERELSADATAFVDSREVALPRDARVEEGALVVWVSAPAADPKLARHYTRAGSMVDWFSEAGELSSLHNDQSFCTANAAAPAAPTELTEIVFVETSSTRTSLVIVNGPEEQPARALELVLRNTIGEERCVSYAPSMAPFSVHRIRLAELVEDLASFCGGAEATIHGSFAAQGMFTRPYVTTECVHARRNAVLSAFHGGDRYLMRGIPRIVHRTLPYRDEDPSVPLDVLRVTGQKEMNPAYAAHSPSLTTRVHLFQSHGDIDEDFAVDATLYDRTGRIVAQRERWGLAPRRGATTLAVTDLVEGAPFEGHIALRFSDDAHELFPRRLQALMEYRSPVSLARTMLWSDRWNAPDRLRVQRPYRALYRVLPSGPYVTTLAITNPGVGADYEREAPYVVRLRLESGLELVQPGVLGPHATAVATIDELFPDRPRSERAIAIVESLFDLASVQLATDVRSGVVAAEHLLPIFERDGDHIVMPCGS